MREGGTIGDTTVLWALLDDSSDDFVYDSGLVLIEDGKTETTLIVTIRPDEEPELDELFTIRLTNVSQVSLLLQRQNSRVLSLGLTLTTY